MKALYEKVVRTLATLPYGFRSNRQQFFNARCARNTMALLNHIAVRPATLIDVGANNSQWTRWLKSEFPDMRVISFEPLAKFKPIGEVYRMALGNFDGTVKMSVDGPSSHVSEGGGQAVPQCRFDGLRLDFNAPAILKVDAETSTYAALEGFGYALNAFALVIAEMWNHYPHSPQFRNQQADIWQLMLRHGFRNCRVVDAEWTAGDGVPVYDMAFWQ